MIRIERGKGLERSSDHAEACPICGLPAVAGHSCAERSPGVQQADTGQAAATLPPPSSLIGRTLGQTYLVVEPIGAGAMGVVYVVEHLTLKKRFAAKLLTADLARFPEAVARFEVEAHAVSQLDHENIVSVIDFGKTDDGCVFIIMELLRGKTLQARMDQGPLSAEETVAIMMQVCRALAAAHAAGIVHRDMKPDNIFLTQRPGGRPMVKVLDFGISKARETSLREGRITKQGQLLGSPEYMSPEASRGDEVDARADIYAVGVMLYELLCGDVPFRHENYLKVLQMHATQPPRPPRELVPDLPVEVEALILRALEKDPRHRQASIEELEAELLAAMPEVAQRALIKSGTPPHGHWLARSTRPLDYVSGTSPDLLAERTGMSGVTRPSGDRRYSTIQTGRRRPHRGLLVAMWSAIGLLTATAVLLVVARPPPPPEEREPAPRQQSGLPAGAVLPPDESAPTRHVVEVDAPAGAADREGRPGEIRLRISTAPPGAMATLEGKRLGRTPLDVWIAAAERDGELELELRGYRSAARSIPLDRDGDIHLSLQREPRRSTVSSGSSPGSRRGTGTGNGGRSGKGSGDRGSAKSNGDDGERTERPPPADLDIKEGR